MSKEMLAAGLAAAAAAISASPAARRKIRDAGLDAADTASQAASNMVSSATKLGSIIAEAVAEADGDAVFPRPVEHRVALLLVELLPRRLEGEAHGLAHRFEDSLEVATGISSVRSFGAIVCPKF